MKKILDIVYDEERVIPDTSNVDTSSRRCIAHTNGQEKPGMLIETDISIHGVMYKVRLDSGINVWTYNISEIGAQ